MLHIQNTSSLRGAYHETKKILIVSVSAVILIALIIILTYCGGGYDRGTGKETEGASVDPAHTHTWGE